MTRQKEVELEAIDYYSGGERRRKDLEEDKGGRRAKSKGGEITREEKQRTRRDDKLGKTNDRQRRDTPGRRTVWHMPRQLLTKNAGSNKGYYEGTGFGNLI